MTLEEFQGTLSQTSAPVDLPESLQALWIEANGDWDAAHRLVQHLPGTDNAWVHAYLHRKEGDLGNAAYWYRQANRTVGSGAHDDEWQEIARELLRRL